MRIAGLLVFLALLAWPFAGTLVAYLRAVRGARMLFPDPYDPRAATTYSLALAKAAVGFVVRGAISLFLLANIVPVAREADRWHNALFAWAR